MRPTAPADFWKVDGTADEPAPDVTAEAQETRVELLAERLSGWINSACSGTWFMYRTVERCGHRYLSTIVRVADGDLEEIGTLAFYDYCQLLVCWEDDPSTYRYPVPGAGVVAAVRELIEERAAQSGFHRIVEEALNEAVADTDLGWTSVEDANKDTPDRYGATIMEYDESGQVWQCLGGITFHDVGDTGIVVEWDRHPKKINVERDAKRLAKLIRWFIDRTIREGSDEKE